MSSTVQDPFSWEDTLPIACYHLRIEGNKAARPQKVGIVFTLDLARAHIRELTRQADDHRQIHRRARAPAPPPLTSAAADPAMAPAGTPARGT